MPEDVHWKKYEQRFRAFPALIKEPCNAGTEIVVAIPVCAEPDLLNTLTSLTNCEHDFFAEVILLFNKNAFMSADDIRLHDKVWEESLSWTKELGKANLRFLSVYVETMPDGKGGVGWARKLAMDEAARRLGQDGIIVCLDGDCTVSSNYLQEIYNQFKEHSSFDATSIYFEHYYDPECPEKFEAIIHYELHLRYLVHAQRWCGHPFAFQTVGSSMAVRRNGYLSQGGMNTKRAGEDFYFLQKFIETGKLFEIRNTTVYPSSRVSDRVPFGTGKAMQQMKEGNPWLTRNFETFKTIKPLFQSLPVLREKILTRNDENLLENIPMISEELLEFLQAINFSEEVSLIVEHTSSQESFVKRFFRYFNAFQMIRYMHYMRDHHDPDVSVEDAVYQFLLASSDQLQLNPLKAEEYLVLLRSWDKLASH